MFLISQKCFLELLLHDSGVADLRFSRGGGGGGCGGFSKKLQFQNFQKSRFFVARFPSQPKLNVSK